VSPIIDTTRAEVSSNAGMVINENALIRDEDRYIVFLCSEILSLCFKQELIEESMVTRQDADV